MLLAGGYPGDEPSKLSMFSSLDCWFETGCCLAGRVPTHNQKHPKQKKGGGLL